MRIQEWEFIEGHPVYQGRAAGETRWPAPLSQMRPRAYTPSQPPGAPVPMPTREPLLMEMVGHPSVDIHMSPEGHTVQTVRLASQHAKNIRIDQIEHLAYQWHNALRRLSRGPLTGDDLREMGHPYGYQHPKTREGFVKPTFGSLRKPRTIPGYAGQYRTGARGFVVNRAVINIQSGKLERSWRYSVLRWSGGITLNFWNTAKSERGAPYPFFLAHGTIFMQAHGPWPFVAEQLLPQIQDQWRQGAAEAARGADLTEGLYGTAAVASQDRIAEAGGVLIMAVAVAPADILWVLNNQLGRPVPILDEMLAALQVNLWPALEHAGFDADACKPRSFHYAGEAEIGKFGWPAIVVGGAFNAVEFGMGHMDENEVAVTCAFPPQISRGQLQNSLDVVGVIRAIFYHSSYRSNHRDPDDATRLIWNDMHPLGFRIIPGDFQYYGGWMARFLVRQPPGSNLWGTGI